ncbi:MAG TPA: hypothetical protein VM074_09985, partial [Solimonas sp.]|nr:hypothetical protein [Solimonas sp.]
MRIAVPLLFSLAFAAAAQDESAAPLLTPAVAQCAAQAHASYAEALQDWHRQNTERMVQRRTDLAGIAQQAGRNEGDRAIRDGYRVRYLAINAPYRLHVTSGIAALGESTWSAEDESRLRVVEPGYAALADQLRQGEERRAHDAHLAAFEKFIELEWLASPGYLASVRALG